MADTNNSSPDKVEGRCGSEQQEIKDCVGSPEKSQINLEQMLVMYMCVVDDLIHHTINRVMSICHHSEKTWGAQTSNNVVAVADISYSDIFDLFTLFYVGETTKALKNISKRSKLRVL